jgi:hypothetical protein
MKLGTHNSGTYSNIVWWQKPFKWLSNLTSKCQNLTIQEQLKNNVRIFNFQVVYYKNNWYISHGLFIYNIKLLDILKEIKDYNTDNDIYIQLILDNNFIIKNNVEQFKVLIALIISKYTSERIKLQYAKIESNNSLLYGGDTKIDLIEYYWSLGWAKLYAKTILDKLPLPRRWASKYNNCIIPSPNTDYLMLDVIELYDRVNIK